MQLLLLGKIRNLFSVKKRHILSLKPNKQVGYFLGLVSQKRIKMQVDGPYPFENIPRLIAYFGVGKHQGKVVVRPGNAE
jgi:hypothetical protein